MTATTEKTEEQRRRLADAVKNVFVFKNLDPEARTEVLNVMLERKVVAGYDRTKIAAPGMYGEPKYLTKGII